MPRRDWIDSVTRDNPVFGNRLDGHMNLANSPALAAAHLSRDTKDIAGGEIVRDAAGELTGVLKDNAQELVFAVMPPPPAALEERALDTAMAYVASYGVTSVHNMGTFHDVEVFRRAHGTARQKTRIYAAVPLAEWQRLRDTVARRCNRTTRLTTVAGRIRSSAPIARRARMHSDHCLMRAHRSRSGRTGLSHHRVRWKGFTRW